MAQPPPIIDLRKDDTNSHQAILRKLIAIDQEFAEDLTLQAVCEIEKLWPDLKAERFASQDILDLSNALRTGNVHLKFRMLRPFLVLWKDNIRYHQDMSSQQLVDLAVSLHGTISRQLGPTEEKGSAANAPDASKVNDVPERSYTDGYYIDQFCSDWPHSYYDVFHWEEGGGESVEVDDPECIEDARRMWPDLDEKLIPKWIDLIHMAISIYHAGINLEFRLLRPFVVCWMKGVMPNADTEGGRATNIRDMVLAQMGPANMVTHNNCHVTILREKGEEDYNLAENSDLEDEEREQAKRHRLVIEVLYPRHRPPPPERKTKKRVQKRKRASSSSIA